MRMWRREEGEVDTKNKADFKKGVEEGKADSEQGLEEG